MNFKVIYFFSFFVLLSCQEKKQSKTPSSNSLYLKIGHDMPKNTPQAKAIQKWGQLLKKETAGKIQFKIFGNQKAGTDYSMLQKLKRGVLDIALPPTSKLGNILPEASILDLPYLFEHHEDYINALDGKLGKYILGKLDGTGLLGLGYFEAGLKNITSNKLLEKSEKHRFRVMKSSLIIDHYKALEYQPIHIEFHNVAQALKDKNIDSQENPLTTIYSMGFYKHQKYLYLSEHGYLSQMVIANENIKTKLSREQYNLLLSTLQQAIEFERQLVIELEQKNLHEMKKIIQVKTTIPSWFLTTSKKYRDETLSKHPIFKKLVFETPKKDDLIIGLDLSITGKTENSGKSIQAGVELALREINAKNSFKGTKLRYITRDNNGFPARGKQNLHEFFKEPNLVAIMGGMHSPVAIQELPLIDQKGVPFLIPWAAATFIVSNKNKINTVYRLSVRDEYAGEFLVSKAFNKGSKKISLVLENTLWGTSNEKSMKSALLKRGLKPTSIKKFNWGTESFSDIINQIKTNGSDAILFVGNAPEAEMFIKSLQKFNVTLPIYSHWGITGGDFFNDAKNAILNSNLTFLQTYTLAGNISSSHKLFANKIRKILKLNQEAPIPSPAGAIHSYELTHIFAKALLKAKSNKLEDINYALQNITTHKGLFKSYQNPFQGLHEALDIYDFSLCKYDSIGNIILVK